MPLDSSPFFWISGALLVALTEASPTYCSVHYSHHSLLIRCDSQPLIFAWTLHSQLLLGKSKVWLVLDIPFSFNLTICTDLHHQRLSQAASWIIHCLKCRLYGIRIICVNIFLRLPHHLSPLQWNPIQSHFPNRLIDYLIACIYCLYTECIPFIFYL